MRKQITILIADNSAPMRGTLRIIIESIDNVELIGEAKNGEEAITLAVKHCPDIIVMDINMSPINGFEATRKILKENPAIRIIGLSMHKKISYAKNLMQLGAFAYIAKSSQHYEIIEAIKKVAAGEKYIDKGLEGKIDI